MSGSMGRISWESSGAGPTPKDGGGIRQFEVKTIGGFPPLLMSGAAHNAGRASWDESFPDGAGAGLWASGWSRWPAASGAAIAGASARGPDGPRTRSSSRRRRAGGGAAGGGESHFRTFNEGVQGAEKIDVACSPSTRRASTSTPRSATIQYNQPPAAADHHRPRHGPGRCAGLQRQSRARRGAWPSSSSGWATRSSSSGGKTSITRRRRRRWTSRLQAELRRLGP